MKKVWFILFFITTIGIIAGIPRESLLDTTTVTLGAGTSDTITITNLTFQGDSSGIALSLDKDSISASVLYQYVSPDGTTDSTSFGALPELFDVFTTSAAGFSEQIPLKAGNSDVYLYVILTNDKASTQVVTAKTYHIYWR